MQPDNGLVIASESVVAHDMVSLAWLLYNRSSMPDKEKNGFMDTSQMVSKFGNRMVVNWLGRLGTPSPRKPSIKTPSNTIWDDRALNHAYEVFGGVPDVILESSNDKFPTDLKKRLDEMTAYPLSSSVGFGSRITKRRFSVMFLNLCKCGFAPVGYEASGRRQEREKIWNMIFL